jgi:hypothetical protein
MQPPVKRHQVFLTTHTSLSHFFLGELFVEEPEFYDYERSRRGLP